MNNIEKSLQRIETGAATVEDADTIRAYIDSLKSMPRVMTVDQIKDALQNEKVMVVAISLNISENTLYSIRSGRNKSIVLSTAQKLTDYFLTGGKP